MTTDKEHSAPFTASDIQRYHSGQMSPQEMHLLEKAALDDPFLADALEGYAFTATPVQDMAEIRERLKQKTGSPRIIPLFTRYPWLRAAAIIIFIVGAGWLAWQFSLKPKGEIAIQPPAQQEKAQQSDPYSETKAPGTDSAVTPEPTATEQDARETITANKQTSPVSPARTPAITRSQPRPVPVQSAPARYQTADQENKVALRKETNKDENSRKYEPAYRQRHAQAKESGPSHHQQCPGPQHGSHRQGWLFYPEKQ
jgi:cytoskeletal protein RodZ